MVAGGPSLVVAPAPARDGRGGGRCDGRVSSVATRADAGPTEVADALGIAKLTAHALLGELADAGLTQRLPCGRYRLGWRTLGLARTMLAHQRVDVTAPTIRRLAIRFGETVHLTAWERGRVLDVATERPPRGVEAPAEPVAAGLTPPGAVLLAERADPAAGGLDPVEADRIHRLGYAVGAQRALDGVYSPLPRCALMTVPRRPRLRSVLHASDSSLAARRTRAPSRSRRSASPGRSGRSALTTIRSPSWRHAQRRPRHEQLLISLSVSAANAFGSGVEWLNRSAPPVDRRGRARRLTQIVRGGRGNLIRVRRATIIMESASGTPVPAIARLVAADEDTVRDVLHAFNQRGLATLDPQWAGGRPRRGSVTTMSRSSSRPRSRAPWW